MQLERETILLILSVTGLLGLVCVFLVIYMPWELTEFKLFHYACTGEATNTVIPHSIGMFISFF